MNEVPQEVIEEVMKQAKKFIDNDEFPESEWYRTDDDKWDCEYYSESNDDSQARFIFIYPVNENGDTDTSNGEAKVIALDAGYKKISLQVFSSFVAEYASKKHSEYAHVRFGQAFMNKYYHNLGGFVEIYYGENNEEVVQKILDTFIAFPSETLLDILWKGD